MLRIHFMQQWFTLSDLAMEEALHDVSLLRDSAGLAGWTERLPDETTILRFRHLLEKHELAARMLSTVNELLQGKGAAAEGRHGRGCHTERCAQFDHVRNHFIAARRYWKSVDPSRCADLP